MKKAVRKFYYWLKQLKYALRYSKNRQVAIQNDGILLVTQNFERQGAPVLLLNIAKWLNNNGYHIVVVSTKYGALIEDFEKYATVLIPSRRSIVGCCQMLNRKYGYHKAICNTVVVGNLVQPLKQMGYTVVSMIHEMENLIRSEGYTQNCDIIADFSDWIVFPSNYGYQSFAKCTTKKISENKVRIRNQGLFNVDEQNLSKSEKRRAICNYLGIDISDKFIVLNVATACYRKGFDLFLDLAYRMRDNEKFCFIWVGDKTAPILKRKKGEYNLVSYENLILPGYIVEKNILCDFYGAADILCLTSREEPFGSIVLEAFNAKTPVIAFSGCGGYMDIVQQDKTGYLVPPFDLARLSEKLEEIEQSKSYEMVCKNCGEEVKKHSFDGYCEFIIHLFDGSSR